MTCCFALLHCLIVLPTVVLPTGPEPKKNYGVMVFHSVLRFCTLVMFSQGRVVSRELAEVHDGSAQHDSEHRCANLVLAQQQSCPIDFYLVTMSQSYLHLNSITIFLFLYIAHFNLDLRCVVECKLL